MHILHYLNQEIEYIFIVQDAYHQAYKAHQFISLSAYWFFGISLSDFLISLLVEWYVVLYMCE